MAPFFSTAAAAPVPGLLATSTVELTLRMGVALTIIMAILYVATRFARRQIGTRGADRPHIEVKYQRQLTKHATLSLVTAGDRNLLIASNNQAITLLAEGDDLTATPGQPARRVAAAAADPTASMPVGDITPGADKTSIDIRPMPKGNPIRALQNRTVRRG